MSPSHNCKKFCFQKVNGLLAEVQTDWEDRRSFLPSKPLVGTTGFILNLQPNQQEGLFLPIDDEIVFSSPHHHRLEHFPLCSEETPLAVKINDDGTLYVELPAILVKLREFVKRC